MRKGGTYLVMAAALAVSGTAAAQLLPSLGNGIGQVAGGVGQIGGAVGTGLSDTVDRAGSAVDRLARTRLDRIGSLVRRNPQALDFDMRGDAAVKGELIVLDMTTETMTAAAGAGFTLIEQGVLDGLGIPTARLRVPAGMSLAKAETLLAQLAPSATIQSNPIYQQSAAAAPALPRPGRPVPPVAAGTGAVIGMIDGGVAVHPALPKNMVRRSFVGGPAVPSDHGTAVASILVGRGAVRGVSPQSQLVAADVYGRDPAGGNALAISRALGWLVLSGAKVVNISLAGPPNKLLARAIEIADGRGVLMVAAVGNDGAAAPAAYPASYPQVIAVTGVDGRGRALIEAGRASHLDFAAPGANLLAARARGGTGMMRGTSFAAPFVAGRLAHLSADTTLPRARAIDLLAAEASLPKGQSARLYGRGIVCGQCATR